MKISTSSSLLFATLAISSSSTSLAAPAGDSSQPTGISTSSSNHHMASRRGSFNIARSDVDGVEQKRSIPCAIETLLPIVGPLLAPVINGLLGITCDPQAQSVASEASENSLSASGAGDDGNNSNQNPNAPRLPSPPSPLSPPPSPSLPVPPNTPSNLAPGGAPGSQSSSPSERRDVRRSLPPRDGSADGDQEAVSQTTPPLPIDPLKKPAGSAESHIPAPVGAVGNSTPPSAGAPSGLVQNPSQAPETAKGELPNNTPVGGTVKNEVPEPAAGAAGTAESAPPKRGTPEW